MKRLVPNRLIHLFLIPITVLILIFGVIIISCKKENAEYSIQDLLGTWEFAAFVASDGSLRTIQRYDCEDCYTITFYEDSTMTGRSSINTLAKAFILSGNHISFPWGVLATEVLEEGDPLSFTEALLNVRSFSIEESNLKLFYTENKFLLCLPN